MIGLEYFLQEKQREALWELLGKGHGMHTSVMSQNDTKQITEMDANTRGKEVIRSSPGKAGVVYPPCLMNDLTNSEAGELCCHCRAAD